MALILLRIAKRSATLEEPDLQTIIETEFSRQGNPDLRLSVYQVQDDLTEIVRAYAEHSATNLDPTFRSKPHFDVTGLEPRPAVVTPSETDFEFLSQAHREIQFENETELRNLVEQLRHDFSRRHRLVSKHDAEMYVKRRLLEGDREWLAIRAKADRWAGYLDKLTRR